LRKEARSRERISYYKNKKTHSGFEPSSAHYTGT
jgi:hypothetical protein